MHNIIIIIMQKLAHGAQMAEGLCGQLLQLAVAKDTIDEVSEACGGLLRALDAHHPQAVDAGVNALLGGAPKPAAATGIKPQPASRGAHDSAEEEDDEEDGSGKDQIDAEQQASRVFEFVHKLFAASGHAPLRVKRGVKGGGGGAGERALTLNAALTAPAARVRCMVSSSWQSQMAWSHCESQWGFDDDDGNIEQDSMVCTLH
jgi:hypothetical protein